MAGGGRGKNFWGAEEPATLGGWGGSSKGDGETGELRTAQEQRLRGAEVQWWRSIGARTLPAFTRP